MTTTSRVGSKPPQAPEKTGKTEKTDKTEGKDKDKDSDSTDQDNLKQAIDSITIMMLQKIINGAKARRAEMKEDDPDAF